MKKDYRIKLQTGVSVCSATAKIVSPKDFLDTLEDKKNISFEEID